MNRTYWFTDCLRRNLVDMHIDDWNDEFLSRFDPEDYVRNLKRAHIQAPMLYLQSHAGHCYWPTKTGHMHRAFNGCEDKMRTLAELCHREGMKVVGYYSLIYNTYEEDRHPQWRIVSRSDGTSARQRGGRYGHCCPNNPEYRAFVLAQIGEMAEYFDVDGMFYDMTFWPDICFCEHCLKRYREKTGRETLPAVYWNDPVWLQFQTLRVQWMGEFARLVTDETKRLMPGCTVEHNYANAVADNSSLCCSTELVNDACDYTGGDLYGDLYNHSFTAKYYYGVTKNPPLEYMTCRCDRSLSVHTNSKTEEHLAVEVMLTAAHHGASFIIDAIDPVGTLDSRVYDRVGRVFERQMPYEPYFRGEMVQDVGVCYSTTGRYNTRGLNFTNKTCAVALTRTLIEENIPVGVIANTGLDQLNGYRMVFAPHIAGLSDENRTALADYVKNGGVLYLSGAEDRDLLKLLLDAELTGYTEENAVYMAPTADGQQYFGQFNADYPFPAEMSLPILSFASDVTVLAQMTMPYTKPSERRFASIHSNPPGIRTEIPAMVTKKLGKGTVIWSACPVEKDDRRSHKSIIRALIGGFGDSETLTVKSDAPRQTELVTFRNGCETLVSAVDLMCTDELLPVRSFEIAIKCSRPAEVIRIGGRDRQDEEVPFAYENGYVRFRAQDLVMFDMWRIR